MSKFVLPTSRPGILPGAMTAQHFKISMYGGTMTKRLTVWAVGLAVVVAASLPLVFHAQPRSPQPAAAAAATPSPVPPAASPAPQHHPRIEAAIHHLEEAKHELEAAPEEFHGHRVKAIEHVNHALEECHKALEVRPDRPAEGRAPGCPDPVRPQLCGSSPVPRGDAANARRAHPHRC